MNITMDMLTNQQYELVNFNGESFICKARAGTGKEEANSTPIPTPNGWTTMGKLKVGDKIFSENGEPITVTGVFPQGLKQTYKIEFRDRIFTRCGIDHLWQIKTCWGTEKVMSTKDLMTKNLKPNKKSPYQYQIPMSKPVIYNKKQFLIDPYLLGVLIGDGSTCNGRVVFSNPDCDNEILEKVKTLISKNYRISKNSSGECPYYTIVQDGKQNKYMNELRRLNLDIKSINKFIPDDYMLCSVEQRKELLAGLMDTDGSCRKNRTHFHTSSKKLCDDVCQLVRSLGGAAIVSQTKNRPSEYNINVRTIFNPFYLKRKADEWCLPTQNIFKRGIKSITKDIMEECTCISVDNPTKLYLTNHYIVTHNTFCLKMKLLHDIESKLIDPKSTCLVCFNKEIEIEWSSYKTGITTRTSHNLGCLILGQIMGKLGLISPTKTSMLFKKYEKKNDWNLSAAAKKSLADVRRKYLFNKISREEALNFLKIQIVKNRGHEKTCAKEASMIYAIWGETIATMDTMLSYDDMVFGPLEMIARDSSLVGRIKTSYDLIVVDESQDFTWAQIELIKLMRPKRLYAMLDDCQTIYTFNGASHLNILEYAKEFDCEEFYLTKSRRCPRSVVKYIAQKAVPDFDCFPKNPEGHMCPMLDDTKNLQTMIDMDDIALDSDFAIISRWNASLMNIGLSLLHAKIPFFYRKSIAEDLARFMKTEAKKAKFKTHLNMMNQFKKHLTGVLETREKLLEEKGSKISDWEKELFYSAIEICSNTQWQDTYTNIDLLCKDIKRMGKDKKGLVLITGHGAKGLEYNNIIVVDPHKVEAQAITEGGKCPQSTEFNIWYVMHSRTKLNLWQRKSETIQEWISKYHSGEIYE